MMLAGPSFIGATNQGYVVLAEQGSFIPNESEAVVLAYNAGRNADQYVTWRASRDSDGNAVYWAGYYTSDHDKAWHDMINR
jgi:hypothetical protein